MMEMRIVEAENIQAKYKTMLATLKQENYTKGNKIRTLESTVLSQNKEVKKFELALKEALKACKIAREKLAEVKILIISFRQSRLTRSLWTLLP